MRTIKIFALFFILSFFHSKAMPPPDDAECADATLSSSPRISRKRKNSFEEPKEERKASSKKEKKKKEGCLLAKGSLPEGGSLHDIFKRILETPPEPITSVPQCLSAEIEQNGGSRRFVKMLPSEGGRGEEDYLWHIKASEAVKEFQKKAGFYLAKNTNVALARISFFGTKGFLGAEELKSFFVSGWPANNHQPGAQDLVDSLSGGSLGEEYKEYSDYSVRFITQEYKADAKPDAVSGRSYGPFFEQIGAVVKSEKEKEDKVLGETRISYHEKLVKSTESIRSRLYFHSEQALRSAISDKITKFKRSHIDGNSYYAIVDVCSYYDMCWCCGDTLLSCAHTRDFGLAVYFRVSGVNSYFENPFEKMKALREEKALFSGYESGKAYEKNPYKPYIAHTTLDDIRI